MQYLVQCTRTRVAPKNLSVMVCTGMHWIFIWKWSNKSFRKNETVGNGRKQSETVGNMIRPKLVQPAFFLNKYFRATPFFFESKGVQGETVGNSRRSHLRSAKKPCLYAIFKQWTYATKQLLVAEGSVRSGLQPFPLGHLWTFIYIRRCAEMFILKKCGLNKFWPDHVCFRPFPTVSDRFRPFHFFWTIYWTTSIYGRLIQCKPVQTMTLKFFGATLVRVHCTKYCILTLISNIP